VSTFAAVLEAPEPAAGPPVNFTRVGRIARAATIVLGIASAVLRAPAQAKRL
jgi:hypothetical protein